MIATLLVLHRSDDDAPALPDASAPVAVIVDAAPADAATAVTITLDGVPAGSELKLGDKVVGTAPKVVLPRGDKTITLSISAQGFYPTNLALVPDHDQSYRLELEKRVGLQPKKRVDPNTGGGG